jgi:hypothetical protein
MCSDDLESFLNKLTESRVLKIPGCRAEYSSPEIMIGGNCCASYSKILSGITRRNKIFRLDKKMVYPQAKYLNICAYFNAVRKIKEKNLIPIYVREFVPFGGR